MSSLGGFGDRNLGIEGLISLMFGLVLAGGVRFVGVRGRGPEEFEIDCEDGETGFEVRHI